MAKPGLHGDVERQRLAALARNAVDLGGGELTGEQADRARVAAERKLGLRCGGCGGRIGVGFEFTRIDVVMQDGRPAVDVQKLSACNGANGCDFATKAREGADAVRMIENVWCSGEPPVGAGETLDVAIVQAKAALRDTPEGRAGKG